ncbi:MAG: dipeptidase [Actinomycetota bacterium]|nr:dipeptidase [Actinomycetota bacterium]
MDLIDAHIETFLWARLAGYDLTASHGPGLLGGRLYSQVDVPRMLAAGMTGAVFSIATNPFRSRAGRGRTVRANLARLRATLESHPKVAVVDTAGAYRRARAEDRLGVFLALQGGNAVDASGVADLSDTVTRVTLVHLTGSALGTPSVPVRWGRGGLTSGGRAYVEALNARRILVDLAHVDRRGFWDALAVHDRSQPAIVSHTGVRGVHDHWRNIDDAQIEAIAELGGVVGIMYHAAFLGGRSMEAVVRHVEHVIRVAGDDHVCLGSDWDGFIVPPPDLRSVTQLPALLRCMADRGLSEETVAKVAGANYLRVMEAVRP